MECFLLKFLYFCYFFSEEGSHSLGHFWSDMIYIAYESFGSLYPALNPLVDPKDGVDELNRTSLFFRHTKEFCFAVLGGCEKDTQAAEDMYDSDLERIIDACPPTPSGYRTVTYLSIAKELGHRPAMFLYCFPGHVRRLPNGRWRFEGLYDVKTSNRYRDYTLHQRSEEAIENFRRAEPMREWGTANTAFHYASVEALDMDINERATKAGYPNWTFSSYSPRRGRVNERIGNLIFQGYSLNRALTAVRTELGWATAGDTAQDYVSPLGKHVCCSFNFLYSFF
jgi:hypothetical protein